MRNRPLPPSSTYATASVLCLAAAVSLTASASAQERQLGYEPHPAYLDSKEVVLTFDDGPGWPLEHTLHVLDVLKEHGKKATFFINTHGDISDGKEAIERIIREGHELGTHTRSHASLPPLSADQVREEIAGVADDLQSVLGIDRELTLFRAPYGHGYQSMVSDQVKAIAAESTVHIGWNLDSDDWRCAERTDLGVPLDSPDRPAAEAECFVNQTIAKLEAGDYGNILMHSIHPRTALGLPRLLQYLDEHGYTVISTEQSVCNALGATSANLIHGEQGCDYDTGGDDDTGGDEGQDADSADADADSEDADADSQDADADSQDADADSQDADADSQDTDSQDANADSEDADADNEDASESDNDAADDSDNDTANDSDKEDEDADDSTPIGDAENEDGDDDDSEDDDSEDDEDDDDSEDDEDDDDDDSDGRQRIKRTSCGVSGSADSNLSLLASLSLALVVLRRRRNKRSAA